MKCYKMMSHMASSDDHSSDMMTLFLGFSVRTELSGRLARGFSRTPMNWVRWLPGLSCSPVKV